MNATTDRARACRCGAPKGELLPLCHSCWGHLDRDTQRAIRQALRTDPTQIPSLIDAATTEPRA